MRQGQQNRRGRGRNRKAHHNPLTRNYESNGPDVKIRGTASHIAEKYMSLARDALASGDPVLAENYLQHAEHYNRIIMAFREQTIQQSGEAMNGAGRHPGEPEDFSDEDGDDGESYLLPPRGHELQQRLDGQQPRLDGQQQRFDERSRRPGLDQSGRPMQERYQESRNGNGAKAERNGHQPQAAEPPQVAEAAQQSLTEAPQRRRDRFGGAGQDQPEFLKRPVRRARRDTNGGAGEASSVAAKDDSGE